MGLTLKINSARIIARFLGVLYRFKLLSSSQCDRMIDKLTVAVLRADLSKQYPKEYLQEDFNGDKSDTPEE